MTAVPLSVPIVPKTARGSWWDQGQAIAQRLETTRWALGDWWRSPDRPNDVTVDIAATKLGLAPSAIWQAAWLAGRFSPSRRRACSHSHHVEVAALDAADADRLLDQAVERSWTVAQIRAARKDIKPDQLRAAQQLVLDMSPTTDAWKRTARWAEGECRQAVIKAEAELGRAIRTVEAMAEHPAGGLIHGNGRHGVADRLRDILAPGGDTGVDLTPRVSPLLQRIRAGEAGGQTQKGAGTEGTQR